MKKFLIYLVFLIIITTVPSVTIAAPENVSVDFFADNKVIGTAKLIRGNDYDMEHFAPIPSSATKFQLKFNDKKEGPIYDIKETKNKTLSIESIWFFGTIFIKSPGKLSFLPWVTW